MAKIGVVLAAMALLVAGCSEGDDPASSAAEAAGAAGAAGSPGGAGGSGAGAAGAGAGGAAAGSPAAGSAGGAGAAAGGAGSGASCTEALKTLLGPVEKVSEGEVLVVKEEGGVKTLYVDASAGGQQAAPENPRVFIDLTAGTRVDQSDPEAARSKGWDLSLKRSVIFSNSGDGGPGQGGARFLDGKAFDEVTSADAVDLQKEAFVSEDCTPNLDATNAVKTTFSSWYSYDESTHKLSPGKGTFVVQGGAGALFKLEVVGYYGKPDGSTDGVSGGRYVLRVAGL